jgi:hypothetical protein
MGEVHPVSVVIIVAVATVLAFLISPALSSLTGTKSFV